MDRAIQSARRFLAVVCLAALVIGALLVWGFRQPRLPEVTAERLAEARQRWRAGGVADYDVEIAVTGRQAAVYAIEVRGGEVRAARRNGEALTGRRTLGTWSVPGMFDTLELDVESQARVAAGKAGPDSPWVDLRAEFEPRWGYPVRCQRVQWGGAGANPEVFWEVRRFAPVVGAAADSPDRDQ